MITDSCWHVLAVALETGTESRHPDRDASVRVSISGRMSEAQRRDMEEEMDRVKGCGLVCVCVCHIHCL